MNLKRKDTKSAIEAYKQVAELFSKSGFDAKAVAIYKQILRIDEGCLEARIQLGDHFQRMALPTDALREFQGAVTLCQERGLKREAFDLLKRVAALDPSNVTNRLGLSDLMLREGLNDEARQEYLQLLEEIQSMDDPEAVVRVGERLTETFPDAIEAYPIIGKAYTTLENHDKAAEVVSGGLAHAAENIELREVLVEIHEARSDPEAARTVWREIAELYKRRGDNDRSREILQRHCPVEAFGPDPDTAPSLLLSDETDGLDLGELADPDSITLDQEAVPVSTEPPENASELEPDVPAAPEPAAPAEIELEELSAEPVAAAAPEVEGKSVEELVAEARVSLEFDDKAGAQALAQEALNQDPNSKEAQAILAEAARSVSPAATDDTTADDTTEPSNFDIPLEVEDAKVTEDPVELGELDQSLPDIELILEDEADQDAAFASIDPPPHVDLGPVEAAKPAKVSLPEEPADPEPEPEAELEIEIEIEINLDDEPVLKSDPEPALELPEEEEPAQSSLVVQRLEEGEAVFESGKLKEAAAAFTAVLEQVPSHPQAVVRKGEIEHLQEEQSAAAIAAELEAEPEASEELETPLSAPAIDIGAELEAELADSDTDSLSLEPEPSSDDGSDFLIEDDDDEMFDLNEEDIQAEAEELSELTPVVEAEAEALEIDDLSVEDVVEEAPVLEAEEPLAEIEDPELHEDGSQSLSINELIEDDGLYEDGSQVLDAAELLEEEAEAEADDVDPDFDLAAALDGDRDAQNEEIEAGFDQVFAAFKKGIQEQLGEEEADAHYDLAIAYKEMGLMEEAVEQLEPVLRSEAHRIEGLSLMATCKLGLERPQEAAGHLTEALALTSEDDESVVPLRFDLALALEAAGKPGEALDNFRKVAGLDENFRDVQERIAGLEVELDPGSEEPALELEAEPEPLLEESSDGASIEKLDAAVEEVALAELDGIEPEESIELSELEVEDEEPEAKLELEAIAEQIPLEPETEFDAALEAESGLPDFKIKSMDDSEELESEADSGTFDPSELLEDSAPEIEVVTEPAEASPETDAQALDEMFRDLEQADDQAAPKAEATAEEGSEDLDDLFDSIQVSN